MQWQDGSPLFLCDIDPKRLENRPIAPANTFRMHSRLWPFCSGWFDSRVSPEKPRPGRLNRYLRFVLIASARGIDFECAPYFSRTRRNTDLLFFPSRRMSGIIKTPMVSVHLAGKHWASLVRVSTDGDDGFDVLTKKLDQVFGPVT